MADRNYTFNLRKPKETARFYECERPYCLTCEQIVDTDHEIRLIKHEVRPAWVRINKQTLEQTVGML